MPMVAMLVSVTGAGIDGDNEDRFFFFIFLIGVNSQLF